MAGPVFAGLLHRRGGRGRIGFDGREFGILEATMPRDTKIEWQAGTLVLAAAADSDDLRLVRDPSEVAPGTATLILVPLPPVGEAHESLAAVAERPAPIMAQAG